MWHVILRTLPVRFFVIHEGSQDGRCSEPDAFFAELKALPPAAGPMRPEGGRLRVPHRAAAKVLWHVWSPVAGGKTCHSNSAPRQSSASALGFVRGSRSDRPLESLLAQTHVTTSVKGRDGLLEGLDAEIPPGSLSELYAHPSESPTPNGIGVN